MNDRASHQVGDTPPQHRPLDLSDTGEASTQPAPPASEQADSSAASRAEDSAQQRADGADDRTRERADASGTSAGFETLLGKIVVETGLVTPEEGELATELAKQKSATGAPKTLADVLIEDEFITQRQLDRVRSEFEAQKSTQRIPGYKIKKKLGSGAMATVFLARQLSLDRLVAIKVLPKKFSDNIDFIERFYKEGRAAAQLNHPNIVQAYDVGQAGEHHYFVMEYVDGETVYDALVRNKKIEEKRAIDIVRQVALALQHAHARGFIHRDIKPKNIMLSSDGVVKLADLGLARAMSDKDAAQAEAGRAYGTPYYISPEQIRGEVEIGPQADIYGLGATFYHMVAGRVPFTGKNPSEVMHRHLKRELVPPDHVNPKISSHTAQVIEMMMAKKPKDRYHNVDDLLYDIELIAEGSPPHFAHQTLDLTDFHKSVGDAPPQPVAQPAQPAEQGSRSLMQEPLVLTLIVFVIASLLINMVLAVLMLT